MSDKKKKGSSSKKENGNVKKGKIKWAVGSMVLTAAALCIMPSIQKRLPDKLYR